MALLVNLSPELQAKRKALVDTCAGLIETDFTPLEKDSFFEARAAIDAFDEDHDLNGVAEQIMEDLVRNGFDVSVEANKPWSVIEIHELVLDTLNNDLDLEDTDLFRDLLQIFNQRKAA